MFPKIGNILWRFRPRFGLRALLLAVTLVCLWLGHEAERWHGEVAALQDVIVPGFSDVYVRGWWGDSRWISRPEELQPWETVVSVGGVGILGEGELNAAIRQLPNVKTMYCSKRPESAEDFRTLIELQRRHPDVDFAWDCYGTTSLQWLIRVKCVSKPDFDDLQSAGREFYQLKGWQMPSQWR